MNSSHSKEWRLLLFLLRQPDQTKPNQTRPETKPNQTRPETKPNQTRPNNLYKGTYCEAHMILVSSVHGQAVSSFSDLRSLVENMFLH